jgi:hypothetical protein
MPVCDNRLSKISAVVVPASSEEAKHNINNILPVDYRLFLVNEGDHDLTNVNLFTGGFEGTDDRLIELNRVTKSLGALRRGSAVDFALWYHFDMVFADGVELKSWFQINKAYALRESRYCPTLRRDGFYFPLEPRSERKGTPRK